MLRKVRAFLGKSLAFFIQLNLLWLNVYVYVYASVIMLELPYGSD